MGANRRARATAHLNGDRGRSLRQVAARRVSAESPFVTRTTVGKPRLPAGGWEPTTVLVIADDAALGGLIQKALAEAGRGSFWVEWETRLSAGLEKLERATFDVVLLDLTMPDCQGLETFDRVYDSAPDALLLVLGAAGDEESARQAVERGAHEYLPKGRLDAYWLPRVLKYVRDRKAADAIVRAAEEALFEEKERAQVTLNSIGDAVLTTDLQCRVTYMNLVAENMTGWRSEEAVGRPMTDVFRIFDKTTHESAVNPAERAIHENRVVELAMNCVLVRRDGSECAIEDSAAPIYNRDGRAIGAVLVFHDVSQSAVTTQKMAYLAQHDALTGLPNRALLTDRLQQAIVMAKRHRGQGALLYLDIDSFKHINDSLGHAMGDAVLESVAKRLTASVRATDSVSRQGGDEFVVLLSEIERTQDAALVAEKLLAEFTRPQYVDGQELHVTLSIGISVFPNDGDREEDLLQQADTAMYHAKARGRNSYQFFRAEMATRAVQRMLVETSLRSALKNDEFLLQFQPQIDLASGAMVGAEALLRWRDPERGLVQPDQFLPTAEECGLIVPIGRWVLREACKAARSWQAAGLDPVPVAVNVSAVEFAHRDFLAGVARILQETGLAPGYLELELTEGILMRDTKSSGALLDSLKSMGVRLAIDDFGTGYSSLSYLRRFPVDTLKIDRSFVNDVAIDADGGAILGAVIAMGRRLRQRVVAEGIETRKQLDLLRGNKCDVGQGFLFSRPLHADDFKSLLEAGALTVAETTAGWKTTRGKPYSKEADRIPS